MICATHFGKVLSDLGASIKLNALFFILGVETWRAQANIYLSSLSESMNEAP